MLVFISLQLGLDKNRRIGRAVEGGGQRGDVESSARGRKIIFRALVLRIQRRGGGRTPAISSRLPPERVVVVLRRTPRPKSLNKLGCHVFTMQ
jgi:hypothetical protein